jgi:protocatechuate 3,4-dioxygenase, beta subunit
MTRTAYLPSPAGTQPPYDVPAYTSTHRRAPHQPLVALPPATPPDDPTAGSTPGLAALEHGGPVFTPHQFPAAIDLSRESGRDAMGQRILVAGRVTDDADRPVAGAMVELWQANAAGRYHHERDAHDAPLDPNFRGAGRVFTDGDGRYRFVSIKPGAYPWRNHHNAWRPAHIHFSLFGRAFTQRLVTQMYFPGDPLFAHDPIFNSVPDEAARQRMIARFDLDATVPEWALGYRFDIVLRGRDATPLDEEDDR